MSKPAPPASIPMAPVVSSNIAAIGYDVPSETLAIRFKSGGLYHYANVPPAVNKAFLGSSSLGSFHHQHIKNNSQYPCTRKS